MLRRMRKQRGFTLIELMIVVAIVGILAVLAIFGVRKYLANAKSAEATNSIGAINQLAVAAFEREQSTAELTTAGGTSAAAGHQICTSSTQVPANVPVGKKYTPVTTAGNDYQTGTTVGGWRCVKFEMTQPQYFSYRYASGAVAFTGGTTPAAPAVIPVVATATPSVATNSWNACASGDLNGDTKNSLFCTGGALDAQRQPKMVTTIAEVDPEE